MTLQRRANPFVVASLTQLHGPRIEAYGEVVRGT
jgi:hypothetical protein